MAANLVAKLLAIHNEETKSDTTVEELWATRGGTDGLDHYLERPGIFRDLEPIEGFAEVLPELQDLGEVVVASSPSRNPDSATDKIKWVGDRFPIPRKNIILISHKHLLQGEVWLEDWGKNIAKIRKTNPKSFIGAIEYPYNESVKHLLNARVSRVDTRQGWKDLVQGIRTFLKPEPKAVHLCPSCGKRSRATTAGCDHCDLEDK
jgi:5'(3')-deoxyribonucleotidase